MNRNYIGMFLCVLLAGILLAGLAVSCGGASGLSDKGKSPNPKTGDNSIPLPPAVVPPRTSPDARVKPDEINKFPAFPIESPGVRGVSRADYPINLTGSAEWDDANEVHKGLIAWAPSGVEFDGDTALLTSNETDIICWVQYKIGDLDGDSLAAMTHDGGSIPDGEPYDVLIANWADEVWDIYRFTANDLEGGSIDLSGQSEEYISPLGSLIWVLAVLDGVEGEVNGWSITGSGDLGIPQSVTASDGTHPDKISISWSGVEYATQYRVFRDTASDGAFDTEIDGSPLTGTQIDDTTIPDFQTYWYKVKATNSNGESELSAADSGYALLAAPENVAATDGTSFTEITVSWSGAGGATQYRVYRSSSEAGTYTEITGSPYTGSPATDTPPDTATYWYKLKAENSLGLSEYSSADSGYIRATMDSVTLENPLGGSGTEADPYMVDSDSVYTITVLDGDGFDVSDECGYDPEYEYYRIINVNELKTLYVGPLSTVTVSRTGDPVTLEFWVKVWGS